MILALAVLFVFVAAGCFAFVVRHAFGRSPGTGFMVLLIPIVSIVYGFTQFEHRKKGLILAGWLGGFLVGVVLRSIALIRAPV